jgi:hypothetical protein
MNKGKKIIVRLFWIVFTLSMFGILAAALTKPLNNLIPWKMAFYTLVWTAVFAAVYIFSSLIENKDLLKESSLKKLLPFYMFLFGAALFAVSVCLRSGPISDYENVYWAAYKLANGMEVTNWDYFSRWTNNVGYMFVLSLLFRPVSFFNSEDVSYYFVLFLNVVQVVLMLRCIVYLAGRISPEHSVRLSLTALIIGSIWLPLWANTSIFYSDQLSLAAAVFGITFLVRGYEKDKALKYSLPAGLMFAIGALIKATSATLLIALVFAFLIFKKGREYLRELAVTAAVFVVVFGGFKLYSSSLPYMDDVEVLKAPVEYWVALGINGSGTYGDSEDFAIECLTAESYEKRKELAREQIIDNISNLWNKDHIIAKARQNFGAGDLGAAGYLIWPENENLLWNFVSTEGIYYWKYACLTTSFFFAWLLIAALGGAVMCFNKSYDEKDMPLFTLSLAFWGLALFLMLWEAQDKQMYNHSGIMILMLAVSLNILGEEIPKVCGKIRNIGLKR